jgi:hypothetical protein
MMRELARRLAPVTLLCALAAPARADDEAKAHYERGTRFYMLGKYADAATEYEQAFELKPVPELLYDAAQAHRLAGDKQRALLLYTNYLRASKGKASNEGEVQRHIRNLQAAIDSEHRSQASPPLSPAPVTGLGTRETPRESPPSRESPPPTENPPRETPPDRPKLLPTEGEARADQEQHGRIKPWVWGVVVVGAALVVAAVVVGVLVGGTSDPSASLGVVRGN